MSWTAKPLVALLFPSIRSLYRRTAAVALFFSGPLLLLQAALAGGAGRPRRSALAAHAQAGCDLRGQPLQREVAIASLPSRVLGDRGDDWAQPLEQPGALRLVEARRCFDVEECFHPRGGDVGMLTAGARGAAGPQLDLAQRQREPLVDPQPLRHLRC